MDIRIIGSDFIQRLARKYGFTARQRRKFPLLFHPVPRHRPGGLHLLNYRLLFTFNLLFQKHEAHSQYPSLVKRLGILFSTLSSSNRYSSTHAHLHAYFYGYRPLDYPFSTGSPAIHRHIHTHTKADSPEQTEIRETELKDRVVTGFLDRRYARWLPLIPNALRTRTAPDIRKRVNHYHYPSTVTVFTGTATEITTSTTRTTSTPGQPLPVRPFAYPLSTGSPAIHRLVHNHTELDFHKQTEIRDREIRDRTASPLDYFTPAGPVRSERQYPLTDTGKNGEPAGEGGPTARAAGEHIPAASGFKGGASPPGIGLHQLTDRVYRLLERKIKMERERRGW